MCYYARMWRVFKVFGLYQSYLQKQLKEVEIELAEEETDVHLKQPDRGSLDSNPDEVKRSSILEDFRSSLDNSLNIFNSMDLG